MVGDAEGDFTADEGICGRLGLDECPLVEEGPGFFTSIAPSLSFFKILFFFRPMMRCDERVVVNCSSAPRLSLYDYEIIERPDPCFILTLWKRMRGLGSSIITKLFIHRRSDK